MISTAIATKLLHSATLRDGVTPGHLNIDQASHGGDRRYRTKPAACRRSEFRRKGDARIAHAETRRKQQKDGGSRRRGIMR
jgi:hypothetical protein